MNSSDHCPLLAGPGDHRIFTAGTHRSALEREILPTYIARCRWFGAKAREPRRFLLREMLPLGASATAARLAFVEIEYAKGEPDTYLLPLQIIGGAAAQALASATPGAVIARFEDGAVLSDALYDDDFRNTLFELIASGGTCHGESGRITASPGPVLGRHVTTPPSRALAVEQSNSSIIYGDHIFLKLYRRLEEGMNPDAEILRFLGTRSFPHVPPFGGAVEYHGSDGSTRILALALGLVPNDGDAWSFTLRHLAQFLAHVLAGDASAEALEAEYFKHAAQLGQRTGELHLALAGGVDEPDFAPEPLSKNDLMAIAAAIQDSAEQVRHHLAGRLDAFDSPTGALAERLLNHLPTLLASADALTTLSARAAKTRTHGDYHLGQVLHGPAGFVIIDFEGEPLRPLVQRRRKMSPFRDVAGMLRSFHYAAHAALEPLGDTRNQLTDTAESWAHGAQQAFLNAWLKTTRRAVFRDPEPATERALLDGFLLEKALYEVCYEANNRPAWLGIPLRGVLALLTPTN